MYKQMPGNKRKKRTTQTHKEKKINYITAKWSNCALIFFNSSDSLGLSAQSALNSSQFSMVSGLEIIVRV